MIGKLVALGLVIVVATIALSGLQDALAEGDKVRETNGEDDGYYDENNYNPYEDDDFPGEDLQNRTGVVV
jgi:hypothetical protein